MWLQIPEMCGQEVDTCNQDCQDYNKCYGFPDDCKGMAVLALSCQRCLLFQSFNLVPVLTVRENIVLPIQLDGGKVDEDYVGQVVSALGLEKKLDNLPSHLSGGQQQRVAIARALATKPAILLADEPTGNLDSRTSQDVLSLMKVTGRKFSQTMVMITHNEEIAQLSDRIVRIEDGRIVTR